jgi:hypothetical protein
MAGLKPVRMGNVLFVTSKTSAAELRAEADLTPQSQPVNDRMNEMIMMQRIAVMQQGGFLPLAGPVAPAVPVPPPPPGGDSEKPPEKPADNDKPTPPAKPPEGDKKPEPPGEKRH